MKLKNFDISSEIELQTGSLFWDIHNFAKFEGLELIPSHQCRCYEMDRAKYSGMTLYFDNLTFLKLTARNPDLPLTEDTCVASILKVDPKIRHDEPYMRTRPDWELASFHLVFQFQSRRVIEIGSDSVELIPVP